ncbi:MAG: PEP-CTERM sorting domain-containing protein [Kiritimatiellae bacterium]|nr:PEP-CTERM sorting domain-containing protein [Kiritimatiellia bacterium]
MKKLLSLIGAAIFAYVANAAALNWQTYADNIAYEGGQAYLIMVTDADNFAISNTLAITGGAVVDNATFVGGEVAGAANLTMNSGNYLFAILATTGGTDDNLPTSGYYGIDYNGDNQTESGFYEVAWDTNTGGSLWADDNYAGVSMTSEVVPEPTSGVLLLLGLAGLALKRKRA